MGAPAVASVDNSAAKPKKIIVPGRIRLVDGDTSAPKMNNLVVIEDYGTEHAIKDGKVYGCKKPGQSWQYF